jgi:hypothetical protein
MFHEGDLMGDHMFCVTLGFHVELQLQRVRMYIPILPVLPSLLNQGCASNLLNSGSNEIVPSKAMG